jgi:hypothetical protein
MLTAAVVSATLADGPLAPSDRAAGETARGGPNSSSQNEIRALVARLGDPQFTLREEAAKKLEQAGIDAIAPLEAAAAGDNLEVTCRAVRVLSRIFQSQDEGTFDGVEAALERLEESSNRSAARRASDALVLQSARRWKRAAARIHELGGELQWSDQEGNLAFRVRDPERGGRPYVVIPPEWKGSDAGLANLKRMARQAPDSPVFGLPDLYIIDGCSVSEQALQQLQQTLPTLVIQRRKGARLGVSCDSGMRSCRVITVQKNSPAERAGLLSQDEIVSFDGEALLAEGQEGESGFARLIELTGRHRPGDKVELEVLRSGKIIKLEAELMGWTSAKSDDEKK